MTRDGDVVMVRQFRRSLERETLEVPAGGLEPGETPLNAARREVREETGYHGGVFALLGSGRLQLNRNTQVEHFAIAVDVEHHGDPAEKGIVPTVIGRADLHRLLVDNKLEQFGLLGIPMLANLKLGIDVFTAPMALVRDRVKEHVGRGAA